MKKSTKIIITISVIIIVALLLGVTAFFIYKNIKDDDYVDAEDIMEEQTSNVWLDEHNRIRAQVGQPPVTWNEDIAKGAADHAKYCQFKHSDQQYRKLGDTILGENLGFGSPHDLYSDKKMMGLWEAEKMYYQHPQYPSQSDSGETGHYTQIVNKNVTEIGCACSECDGSKLCVCRYNPIQMANEYPY